MSKGYEYVGKNRWDDMYKNRLICPKKLINLNCSNTKINNLGILPDSLEKIDCTKCPITQITNVPANLSSIICDLDKIDSDTFLKIDDKWEEKYKKDFFHEDF